MIVLQFLLPMIGVMFSMSIAALSCYMMGYQKGRRDQAKVVEEHYRDNAPGA